MQLDRTEREILRILQQEGRISIVELASRISLSESPTFRRVKALENAGVINAYSARLDQRKIGLQVTAFVQITLDKGDKSTLRTFLAQVEAEEYIVECHGMSGSCDYLLKVVATNMDHFSELCMQRILNFAGVKNIESQFSLWAVKQDAPLPIAGKSIPDSD
ncbi:Lrp/AsnC family transcriptional regulator [Pseudohongiella spirulinae]|uniref:Transcriptional regulator, AsnC family n=1 Tax=Pseudohongiella spirulinae TaxID=1249552 RepID=A0A0S2KGJ2_9GAMM|nr:Lrp/AsnC family transcriptional regulator [Pseudohongiella spirulinae]ALO47402.1 Transcriptional regulator, AsnC family [Pseudohongiella spirulinae]